MTIDVELSPYGVARAIEQLVKYKNDLHRKTYAFIKALADIGVDTAHSIVDWIPQDQELTDYKFQTKGHYLVKGGGSSMTIEFSGSDVLYIEFSAGITYGTDTYPLPSGDGYGMGTHSPAGQWDNPDGWYYKDPSSPYAIDDKGTVHSYGNPAYMPMYHAREEMAIRIWSLAHEIFGSG